MKDEEEDVGIGTTRYPCIPSLVALLQMKNRLHLAQLGKKLMKWTALATTKELRKITIQLQQIHTNYGQLIHDAFISLARCRYCFPGVNHMIIEGPPQYPRAATVTVMSTFRSVTGTKMVHYEVADNKVDSYSCLGLGVGGIEVAEAKRIWRELLNLVILMVELNNNFVIIEAARNSANKKSNVLGKIVIPRINLTIKYITSELDEKAREDFFRMKKIIKVKEKNRRKKEKKVTLKEPIGEPEPCTIEEITPSPCPPVCRGPPTPPCPPSPPSKQIPCSTLPPPPPPFIAPIRPLPTIPAPLVCQPAPSPSQPAPPYPAPPCTPLPSTPSASAIPPCTTPCTASPCIPLPSSSAPSSPPPSSSAPSSPPPCSLSPSSDIPTTAMPVSPCMSATETVYKDVQTKEITKVTRVRRPDGTIVEEIKNIKISKEMPQCHDCD